MRMTGIESRLSELPEHLRKCEVCGDVPSCFVQDIFEEIPFVDDSDRHFRPGGWHAFCDEHKRDSKTIELREGPIMYTARQA